MHLDSETPFLIARGSTTKNGKDAEIPLHRDLAMALKELKNGAAPDFPVFAGLLPKTDVFRADLQKAGIPFLDQLGRRADFHALRHTMGTNLGRAGVAPRVAMEAMRHSDIKLTTRLYTDASKLPTAEAFALLPSFAEGCTQKYTDVSDAEGQRLASTGTDQNSEDSEPSLGNKGPRHTVAQMGTQGQENEMAPKVGLGDFLSNFLEKDSHFSLIKSSYSSKIQTNPN